jgi:acyl-coenzyme A synthetase/AMP-(fatty) acid ligase
VGFASDLTRHGDRIALVQETSSGTCTISYLDLAADVAREAAALGVERRLVLIALDRSIEAVTSYLAILAGGHVALLASESDVEARNGLIDVYDSDVVMARVEGRWTTTERRVGSAHDLHPELAVLLSTSGSTGSPKLVRLSHENVQSNADAIAETLHITDADRAVSTLPLTYSYGLSVLHSHLARGASVLLTDDSVVQARFWDAVKRHGVTSLPGVPHTFDLLDRVGFDRQRLPHLRRVTVAGGRLDADRVRRYAELGRTRGFDLFVMYGQTEATARITVLDPKDASAYPDSIGTPIPGGQVTLAPVDGEPSDVGELVYRGANVMLGYAERPVDLALGRTVHELRTGDLARQVADGRLQVVGRRSRVAKVFGLRIDLDRTEQRLAELGITACVVSDDTAICVVAEGRVDPEHVADCAARASGLPLHVVHAAVLDTLPRLESGKLDRARAMDSCRQRFAPPPDATAPRGRVTADQITALYAQLLGRPDATSEDSFVALGGDSLSFVEVSVRLEAMLGDLPSDWHQNAPASLADGAAPTASTRLTARVETGVVLRAVAILAIVGSHIGAYHLIGGAHVLLGHAGFAVARFLVGTAQPRSAPLNLLRGAARVAVPSALWIAGAAVVTQDYSWANVALVNTFVGPQEFGPGWHFWFVEALVAFLVVTAGVFSLPGVARFERRHPFAFGAMLVTAGLVIRMGWVPGFTDPRPLPASGFYFFWFFAVGWWAARATTTWQRLLVSTLVVASVPGYWQTPARETAVIVGLLVLVWLPTVRLPRVLVPALSVVAASSLAIYLTHWAVFPHFDSAWVALAASIAVGVGVYEAARAAVKVAKSRSFWSAYVSAYSARARSALSAVPR